MAKKLSDTRSQIIASAQVEFLTNGFDGARLQGIADHVGVTKAMIHYYFNTKKELFEHVYGQSVRKLFSDFTEILGQETPLFKKIEDLIELSLQKAEEYPRELTFVITESNRKPDWLIPIFEHEIEINLDSFNEELEQAASNYEIAAVDAQQLLLNILSLCYYPIISSTINQSLLNVDKSVTSPTNRKGIVLDTILNWLTA